MYISLNIKIHVLDLHKYICICNVVRYFINVIKNINVISIMTLWIISYLQHVLLF